MQGNIREQHRINPAYENIGEEKLTGIIACAGVPGQAASETGNKNCYNEMMNSPVSWSIVVSPTTEWYDHTQQIVPGWFYKQAGVPGAAKRNNNGVNIRFSGYERCEALVRPVKKYSGYVVVNQILALILIVFLISFT
jgi:hypothetical protein